MSNPTLGQADYLQYCPVIDDKTGPAQGQLFGGRCGYDYFQPGRYCQESPGFNDCLTVCAGNSTCALLFMTTFQGTRQCCQYAEPITITLGAVSRRSDVDWMLAWKESKVDITSALSFSITATALPSSTSSTTADSTTPATTSPGTQATTLSPTSSYTAESTSLATSATPVAPTSNPAANPSPSPGLSTGAKAGIAVGTIAAVALLAGVLFFAYKRRKGNRGYAGKTGHEASPELETKTGH